MKIAFDAELIFEINKTGIGKTTEYLIKAMSGYKEHEYRLNYIGSRRNKEKNAIIDEYKKFGYSDFKGTNRLLNLIYKVMRRTCIEPPYSLFFGGGSDVTVFFNYYVPPFVKGKSTVIVYDMTYKAHPETMNAVTKKWLDNVLEKSCARAEKIITISQFSKNEIIKYLGIEEDRIEVMPMGVDTDIFNDKKDDKKIEEVKKKFGIEGEYFLYMGTLEPRKNIERLIEAYALLKKEKSAAAKLVLAGKKGWLYDKIFEKVKKYEIEDDVIFTGYVSDEDAVDMMRGAFAFVFVSIYEGFGIPPLEAMAYGTPVIVSKEASLPEVVGNAAILADAYDCGDIKNAMLEMCENNEKREELIMLGKKRAKELSWKNSAEILNDILKRML